MLLCMLSYLAKMSPKERQGVMEMLAMSTGSQPPLSPPQARPQPTPMKAPMPMPTSPMPTSPNPPPTSAAGAGLARRGAAAAHGRTPIRMHMRLHTVRIQADTCTSVHGIQCTLLDLFISSLRTDDASLVSLVPTLPEDLQWILCIRHGRHIL